MSEFPAGRLQSGSVPSGTPAGSAAGVGHGPITALPADRDGSTAGLPAGRSDSTAGPPAGRSDSTTGRRVPAVPRPADMRAELRQWRAGALVLLVCVLAGAGQGVLWSLLAPGEQFKVFRDGTFGALPTESTHQYISIAIFTLLGLVSGIAVAVAAWCWRSVRGSVMLLTVGFGSALGALTAYLIGRSLAGGVEPSSIGPSNVESLVTAPPTLGNALILIAQPTLALAIYTFLAAWNGQPDLGRGEQRFASARARRSVSAAEQAAAERRAVER
jgi:hypothetical protein